MEFLAYANEQTNMSPGMLVFYLVIGLVEIISLWRIYKKAGEPGWAILIPIYRFIVLFRILGMSWWNIIIMFFLPVVYAFIIPYKLAKVFGKDTLFAILSILFSEITIQIIGLGSAEYEG